ncbi:MAG TPA: hypothetical protein VG651_01765 [Stellaceae bacterium]|nr:hypothetical protein [Stellaceae bacterium]
MKARGAGWRSRHPTLANIGAAVIAASLIGFGLYGALRDDFAVPVSPRHSNGRSYHFHGAAAWFVAAGFICVGVSVIIVIVRRLNAAPSEKIDQRAPIVIALAGTFIVSAMTALKLIGLI